MEFPIMLHCRTRMALAAVVILLFAVPGTGCSSDTDEDMAWNLVWQDEFEGPAGQLPGAGKWRFDVGGDGWGNNQLEYDTDRPENVSLDGSGHLAITARKEDYLGKQYTSGRINTSKLFSQERGKFEARIRLPIGRGIWPAFWLLGANFESVGWPACGEIDIMEYRGQEPNVILGTVHGPNYSGSNSVGTRYTLPGANFNDDFHVFAVEWSESRIAWFVDDVQYRVVTPADLPPGGRWVFDHPFFVILNVAVGGNFVGPPDESTVFPQTMLVDWVRVYRTGS
jgi:beta-glucanase (GH16 family)